MIEHRKLSVLLEKGDVILFLTHHIVDEYRRNRETKIAEALKSLKNQKLSLQFPALCKDYEEYSRLSDLQKKFERDHALLVVKVQDIDYPSLMVKKLRTSITRVWF